MILKIDDHDKPEVEVEEEEAEREDQDLIQEELEELHKQVDTDVHNLEHLEEDFKADLERIGQRLEVLDLVVDVDDLRERISFTLPSSVSRIHTAVTNSNNNWSEDVSTSSSSLEELLALWTPDLTSSVGDDDSSEQGDDSILMLVDKGDQEVIQRLQSAVLEAGIFLSRALTKVESFGPPLPRDDNPQEPEVYPRNNRNYYYYSKRIDETAAAAVDDDGLLYPGNQTPITEERQAGHVYPRDQELHVQEVLQEYAMHKQELVEVFQDKDDVVASMEPKPVVTATRKPASVQPRQPVRNPTVASTRAPLSPPSKVSTTLYKGLFRFLVFPKFQKRLQHQVYQHPVLIVLALGMVTATMIAPSSSTLAAVSTMSLEIGPQLSPTGLMLFELIIF